MSEMGAGELGPPTKTTKTTLTAQQQEPPPVSTPQPYSEWAAAAFQAFYGSGTAPIPPHGYFPGSVGSGPQPPPYMWGPQHLMAPYTPPPYAAMYAHSGMYGHPSIPPGAHPFSPYALPQGSTADTQGGATPGSADADGKSSEAKTKNSLKRSKDSLGSLGMLTGKGSESGKGSMSADSGSEGSTEGSEGTSQNGSDGGHKGVDQAATSAAYGGGQDANHGAVPALPLAIAGKQVVGAGPLTNLNIGMDYWNGGAPAVLSTSGSKRPAPGNTAAMIPAGVGLGREVVSNDIWQDERELKRQRRKQSNRESARRSRLRKQAECEELAAKVHALEAENTTLRSELTRTTEQCNKLSAENRSLMEQVQMQGIDRDSDEAELDRKDVNRTRGERRDAGSLQVDNDHFRRDSRAVNDVFTAAKDNGNLAVSVSTG